jgi:SAM-dependent methyltransferase
MFRWKEKPLTGEPSAPYSRLAEIYDYVMRHVDYEHWADYIQLLFTHFRATPAHILELACGTGNMASILTQRGYRVTGVDRSAAMIAVARRKAQEEAKTVTFLTGDMVAPPVAGVFDAILCLYDSINYIMDLDTMGWMLERTRTHLRPGGIFIFDACTEINSRRYFHRQVDQEGTKDFSYIRRSEYLPEQRIQVNEFQLVFKYGDHHDRHVERHEQRIYPIHQIKTACIGAGFDMLGAFDSFSLDAASEKSNRVHFVLRLPSISR